MTSGILYPPRATPLGRGSLPRLLFFCMTALVLGWLTLAPNPSLGLQLAILSAPLLLIGIPHGGLDVLVARALSSGGRAHGLFVLLTYALLALVAAALWWLFPAPSLAAFLIVAVWHFGATDEAADGGQGIAMTLARGALPVTLPALWHPTTVQGLFSTLAPAGAALRLTELSAVGAALALVLVAIGLAHRLRRDRHRWRRTGWEILALLIAYRFAPPLIAFGLYFCFLHAPRSALLLLARLGTTPSTAAPTFQPGRPCGATAIGSNRYGRIKPTTALPVLVSRLGRAQARPPDGLGRDRWAAGERDLSAFPPAAIRWAALWPTLVAVVLAAGIAPFAALPAIARPEERLVAVLFIGLASLTWPHVILHAYWGQKRR